MSHNRLSKPDLFQAFQEHYPDIRPTEIIRGELPHIFLIQSPQTGNALLKIHHPMIRTRVRALDKIYSRCSSEKCGPQFFKSSSGRSVISFKNHFLSIQKKISCTNKKAPIPPELLGRSMAVMHRMLGSISSPETRNHLYFRNSEMTDMARDFGYEFLESKIKRVQQMTSSHSSQIVHGDLHQNNIIQVEDNVLFLDFDSCTHFLPQSDLAFCAFRMYDLRKEETKAYLQAYHAEAGHRLEINHRDLTDLIIYTILQRIFFIKKEYKMGNKMWIIDLKNQESYLSNLVLMKSET